MWATQNSSNLSVKTGHHHELKFRVNTSLSRALFEPHSISLVDHLIDKLRADEMRWSLSVKQNPLKFIIQFFSRLLARYLLQLVQCQKVCWIVKISSQSLGCAAAAGCCCRADTYYRCGVSTRRKFNRRRWRINKQTINKKNSIKISAQWIKVENVYTHSTVRI